MKTPVFNKRKQLVGYFDKNDYSYFTSRDALKNHIFYKKKDWLGDIALDKEIVEQLERLNCKRLIFLILNWDNKNKLIKPNTNYIIYFGFNKFLNKSELISFDKIKMGGNQYRINQVHGIEVNTIEQVTLPSISNGDLK